MNTTQKGKVRCIVFKDGDTWYAVALEFNIIESSDDPIVAYNLLQSAMQGYVESQKKIRGSRVAPLNQKADREYEDLWNNLNSKKPVKYPYQVKSFGFVNI